MKSKSGSKEGGASPSQLIDARIKELSDWRGETLARTPSIGLRMNWGATAGPHHVKRQPDRGRVRVPAVLPVDSCGSR
jgi:hypothetical protein